jgi:hypothetical protein
MLYSLASLQVKLCTCTSFCLLCRSLKEMHFIQSKQRDRFSLCAKARIGELRKSIAAGLVCTVDYCDHPFSESGWLTVPTAFLSVFFNLVFHGGNRHIFFCWAFLPDLRHRWSQFSVRLHRPQLRTLNRNRTHRKVQPLRVKSSPSTLIDQSQLTMLCASE